MDKMKELYGERFVVLKTSFIMNHATILHDSSGAKDIYMEAYMIPDKNYDCIYVIDSHEVNFDENRCFKQMELPSYGELYDELWFSQYAQAYLREGFTINKVQFLYRFIDEDIWNNILTEEGELFMTKKIAKKNIEENAETTLNIENHINDDLCEDEFESEEVEEFDEDKMRDDAYDDIFDLGFKPTDEYDAEEMTVKDVKKLIKEYDKLFNVLVEQKISYFKALQMLEVKVNKPLPANKTSSSNNIEYAELVKTVNNLKERVATLERMKVEEYSEIL